MTHARLLLLAALLATGCAWTRRENRPVWNAFEENLVPTDTGWFVATLPLTVPAGVGSILLDTFVAHPVQIVDDAWDDASELWRHGRPDFREHYWTEMAFLPVRAVLTPTWFAITFVGRSLFDIRSKEEAAQEAAQAAEHARQAEAEAQRTLQAWLTAVAAGTETRYQGRLPQELTDPVRQAAAAALAQGKALGRLHVWLLAIPDRLKGAVDPVQGLRDPDPAVRFLVMRELPKEAAVPGELIDALRQDPVESVRGAARQRWPDR